MKFGDKIHTLAALITVYEMQTGRKMVDGLFMAGKPQFKLTLVARYMHTINIQNTILRTGSRATCVH